MRALVFVLAWLFAGAAFAMDDGVSPALGVWVTANGKAQVELERCGSGLVCGRFVSLANDNEDHPLIDARNQDPALRGRRLQGAVFMTGFKPAGPGELRDGRIYNAKTGRTHRADLFLQEDGALLVRGCLGPFCGQQVWSRGGAAIVHASWAQNR